MGHHGHGWTSLGSIFTAPGFTDERIHLFMATDLRPGQQALEQDEVLEVVRVPFQQALEWAVRDRIRDAKTLCALLRADLHRRLGKENA